MLISINFQQNSPHRRNVNLKDTPLALTDNLSILYVKESPLYFASISPQDHLDIR